MIYHFIPYSLDKNIGIAYNTYCKLVPNDEDWIVIQDADVMILTPDYGHLLDKVTKMFPNTGMFTCYVNRIKPNTKNIKQQLVYEMFQERDIIKHRQKALELYNTKQYSIKIISNIISGYMMMFQKKTWKEVGGFLEQGILKIDNDFSAKVIKSGKRILLLEGMYMLHYYRMLEGYKSKEHLM